MLSVSQENTAISHVENSSNFLDIKLRAGHLGAIDESVLSQSLKKLSRLVSGSSEILPEKFFSLASAMAKELQVFYVF